MNPAIQTVATEVSTNLPAIETVVEQAKTIKTGFKTSEFWIVLGTDVAALLAGILPANSIWLKCVFAGVMALSSIAYIWGRISLKKKAV